VIHQFVLLRRRREAADVQLPRLQLHRRRCRQWGQSWFPEREKSGGGENARGGEDG
jgi:hypothetical protein